MELEAVKETEVEDVTVEEVASGEVAVQEDELAQATGEIVELKKVMGFEGQRYGAGGISLLLFKQIEKILRDHILSNKLLLLKYVLLCLGPFS